MGNVYKIWIDVGHGGNDPGAVALGLVEKLINLVMAISCKSELERHGVLVGMTRFDDTAVSLSERATLANNWSANYFVSIHNNAGGGDRGEVIHSITKGKGLELATKISERIKAETGQSVVKIYSRPSIKNPSRDYYSVIANTKMPAVIVEGAFLDNDLDNNAIDTIQEQKAFGIAVAHGILNQLGIALKSVIVAPTPTPTTNTSTNVMYRVITGSFSNRTNAEKRIEELKKAGFESFIETLEK